MAMLRKFSLSKKSPHGKEDSNGSRGYKPPPVRKVSESKADSGAEDNKSGKRPSMG
jgi:hypothetical protein